MASYDLEVVNWVCVPTQVEVMGQNFVFTTSLFDVQYYGNNVKNNPAKSLVVSVENRIGSKTVDDAIILW